MSRDMQGRRGLMCGYMQGVCEAFSSVSKILCMSKNEERKCRDVLI
jgi:hypothetical protein